MGCICGWDGTHKTRRVAARRGAAATTQAWHTRHAEGRSRAVHACPCSLFTAWLAKVYPSVQMTAKNGCVPATPSAFMELCLVRVCRQPKWGGGGRLDAAL